MMRSIRLSWMLPTLAVTAALAIACAPGSEAAPEEEEDEAAAEEDPSNPIRFEVRARSSKVKLGDEIVFVVTLTNTGKDKVRVNVPRIGRRSLTFRVRQGQRFATVERLHADLSQRQRNSPFAWKPGAAKELTPGNSLETEVSTRALITGKVVFTPQYTRTGADISTAKAIPIEITPDGKKKTLGVRMETSHGTMVHKFRPDLAYNTVESFASLVSKGYFDGLIFHRILSGFMAQGGDPNGDGSGGPGYYLPLEAHTKVLHDRGVLSMARTGHPDTRIGRTGIHGGPHGHHGPTGAKRTQHRGFSPATNGETSGCGTARPHRKLITSARRFVLTFAYSPWYIALYGGDRTAREQTQTEQRQCNQQ